MRVITIPEQVEITVRKRLMGAETLEKSEVVSFQKFLMYSCEGYEKFAKGPKQARQYAKLMDVIDTMDEVKKTVVFEQGDYDILKGAVDSAQWASPDVNRTYIPFYKAFEDAADVKTPQDVKPVQEPPLVEPAKEEKKKA